MDATLSSPPDPAALGAAWPLLGALGALALAPMRGGTNNTQFHVSGAAPDAPSYVLRLAAPHLDERRARLEHATLASLERQSLPFAVPAPVLAAGGAPWTVIATPGGPALATLTRFIPGLPPDRGNLGQAERAGEAVGALDMALATVDLSDPEAALSWRSTGALDKISPLVLDPPVAFAALPISEDARGRLRDGYAALMERLPTLYATLPQQLCHEDTDPSNILMQGERVTGVLDFEFLSRDIRAMDLTVALVWWPAGMVESGAEWPVIAALARGYARALRLTAPEIAAIPTLYAMRGYTSLIHRFGRALQGLSTMAHVVARAEAALAWQDWLAAHGERLVETVAAAMEGD
ncbi:MAG TPA: phosphotransferase [Ktedonobacterales bacterium]|nr:phosphotransferase [Ktedonobacterales bacterium]